MQEPINRKHHLFLDEEDWQQLGSYSARIGYSKSHLVRTLIKWVLKDPELISEAINAVQTDAIEHAHWRDLRALKK